MTGIEMQQVWRTASDMSHNGIFVWEVLEVIGEPIVSTPWQDQYIKCIDGSYIYVQCFQFWTIESAGKILHENEYAQYQTVSIVPEEK